MVRLLPNWSGTPIVRGTSFNPTMVRLLRASNQRCARVQKTFQSHNGAIAAAPQKARNIRLQGKFQSHNGAIAALV